MLKRWWWILAVAGVSGALAGFLLIGVMGYLMPAMFEARAEVEVMHPPVVVVEGERAEVPRVIDIADEMARFREDELLRKVAGDLNLAGRWGMREGEVLRVLGKSLGVEMIGGGQVFSVSVRMPNREDAEEVLKALVGNHREQRGNSVEAVEGKVLEELKRVVEEQEKKVDELGKKVRANAVGGMAIERQKEDLSPDDDAGELARREFEELEVEQRALNELKAKMISEYLGRGAFEGDYGVVVHDEEVRSVPGLPRNMPLIVLGSAGLILISAFPVVVWCEDRRKRRLGNEG